MVVSCFFFLSKVKKEVLLEAWKECLCERCGSFFFSFIGSNLLRVCVCVCVSKGGKNLLHGVWCSG